MTKFAIRNEHDEIISKHKTLELANSKLRKIDSVSHSLYADDVDWLTGQEEALQGYNHSVAPLGRGGKREGAGAPTKPANLKKEMVSVKLPKWLIDWTADQEESRAVLIEEALKKVHKLKTPPEFCGREDTCRDYNYYDCQDDHKPLNCFEKPDEAPTTPPVSPSNSSDLLNAELYNALDDWFDSLDLLMKLNGCIMTKDLRRIYKAYQAIKATGI